jgi:hypothetical protein
MLRDALPLPSRRGTGRRLCFGVALAAFALVVGCDPPPLEYLEVKRIDEEVTAAEFRTWLKVVESLPDETLPPIPAVFAPAPSWSAARTLPVAGLVREEEQMLAEQWDLDRLSEGLERVKPLQRALVRERMTTDQFLGLTLAIGAALSRSTLRETQDLRKIAYIAGVEVDKLKEDDSSFSSLTEDERYAVLLRALWVTRRDRAKRLSRVPAANVELALRNREQLIRILPAEFAVNPFDGIADLLAERGVPFEELPESGTDEHIEWRASDAIIGRDKPDGPSMEVLRPGSLRR